MFVLIFHMCGLTVQPAAGLLHHKSYESYACIIVNNTIPNFLVILQSCFSNLKKIMFVKLSSWALKCNGIHAFITSIPRTKLIQKYCPSFQVILLLAHT